jgi:SAM-dependent methyltransferase
MKENGQTAKRILLNLGCGPGTRRTDWIDLDGSWNLLVSKLPRVFGAPIVALYKAAGGTYHHWPAHVRYLNLNKPLPFQDDSVDAVYASHVWEHLYRDRMLFLTHECFRVLKPGGVLRLVVPDLRHFCSEYLRSTEPEAADILMEKIAMRAQSAPRSLLLRVYEAFTDFHSHKWMYDARSLTAVLERCGFSAIAKRQCFESIIPEIQQVEDPGRVSPEAGFALEAIKPPSR